MAVLFSYGLAVAIGLFFGLIFTIIAIKRSYECKNGFIDKMVY